MVWSGPFSDPNICDAADVDGDTPLRFYMRTINFSKNSSRDQKDSSREWDVQIMQNTVIHCWEMFDIGLATDIHCLFGNVVDDDIAVYCKSSPK